MAQTRGWVARSNPPKIPNIVSKYLNPQGCKESALLAHKLVFLSKLARLGRSERKRAAHFSLTDFEIQPTIRFDQLTDLLNSHYKARMRRICLERLND